MIFLRAKLLVRAGLEYDLGGGPFVLFGSLNPSNKKGQKCRTMNCKGGRKIEKEEPREKVFLSSLALDIENLRVCCL